MNPLNKPLDLNKYAEAVFMGSASKPKACAHKRIAFGGGSCLDCGLVWSATRKDVPTMEQILVKLTNAGVSVTINGVTK